VIPFDQDKDRNDVLLLYLLDLSAEGPLYQLEPVEPIDQMSKEFPLLAEFCFLQLE
jgi:hypothetical protein